MLWPALEDSGYPRYTIIFGGKLLRHFRTIADHNIGSNSTVNFFADFRDCWFNRLLQYFFYYKMAWDLDQFIAKLYKRELLSELVIKELCEKLKEILVIESNVRQVSTPVTIVGDVHGQFYDVLEIFRIGILHPKTGLLKNL